MPTQVSGTVEEAGNWLELRFTHDVALVHALRGLDARRLEMGVWRVPVVHAQQLVTRLEGFGLRWIGDAARLRESMLQREADLQREDRLGLMAKAGQSPLGSWRSPVDLFTHQRVAADFLAVRSSALLCDEQGLGKTLSALVGFWLLRRAGKAGRLLVVCPNSLKYSWRDEIGRFFPVWKVSVAQGYRAARHRAYQASADVYVTNYEAVRSDFSQLRLLLRQEPTILVCDESHAAKNPGSRTAWALSFLRSAAERVWMMSGTPVTNRMEDCYAQVTIADGGRTLGTRDQFWRRYVEREDRSRAADDLKYALAPLMMRRTKEEALELPAKVFEVRHVELTGEQLSLYRAFRDNLYREVKAMSVQEFEAASGSMLTRLLRLSQVASNPRLVAPDFQGDTAKAKEIDTLLEDLIEANGRKVVLWSYYVRTIEEFLERFRKYDPVAVYGRIPIANRRDAVQRFQDDPSSVLFVGNPQAAGTGLTLTAAHYAIYETLTWRYDLYAQSIDRTHRIGQVRNVTYFKILAHDTIDMDIDANLEGKRRLASDILGDVDRLPHLRKDEVLAMLTSRRRGRA